MNINKPKEINQSAHIFEHNAQCCYYGGERNNNASGERGSSSRAFCQQYFSFAQKRFV